MAKYYVQSGNLRRVVSSGSAERAALWVVHQAMQQIAPQFREGEPAAAEVAETVVLDDVIAVSEVGFDRSDALEVETFEAFRKWYSLCESLDL